MARALASRIDVCAMACGVALFLAGCQSSPPVGERLWISDERGDAVIVVDPEKWTVEKRLFVGRRPRGIQVSPDGKHVFVALSGSAIGGPHVDESKLPAPVRSADGIAVLEVPGGRVERIIKAGNDPETFAISADGRSLFVSNEDSAQLSIIDIGSGGVVARIKVGGEPEGVAATKDGTLVFVACEADDAVFVVSVADRKVVSTIPISGRPRTVLLSRDGKHVYVAVENAGAIAVIDVASLRVSKTISLVDATSRPRPMGMVELPGGTIMVSTGRTGSMIEVDTDTGKVMGTVANVGKRPWGIAPDSAGKTIYTANGPSGDIAQIDPAKLTILRRLKVGTSVWGVAVSK